MSASTPLAPALRGLIGMDSRKVQAAIAVAAAIGAIAVARRVANVEGAALGLRPLEVAAVLAIGTTVLARKQGWV